MGLYLRTVEERVQVEEQVRVALFLRDPAPALVSPAAIEPPLPLPLAPLE